MVGGFALLLGSCKPKEVPPPTLTLSSQTIDLGGITSTSTSSLTLTQSGAGTISYTISSDKSWLKVSKASGTIATTDMVSLSTTIVATDLVEDDNTATLTIIPTINGAASSPVRVTVKGTFKTTTITVGSTSVDFGTITASRSVFLRMTKVGTENLTYDVTSDKPWLLSDKITGTFTATDSLRLTANTQTLPGGNQTATLTITPKANGVAGRPITVAVKVNYNDLITGNIEKRTLTKNETWGGNINLNGTVIVPKGFTLTIRPGTKIRVKVVPADKIGLEINGRLIMNGDVSNIIEMSSVITNSRNKDWDGIEANGDVEISYSLIRDANYGVNFLFSGLLTTPIKAPVIHHCLFDNCFDAIYFLESEFETVLFNLTFRRLSFNSLVTTNIKKLTLNEIEFSSDGSDIGIYSNGLNIKITNSNFVPKEYTFYKNVFVFNDARYANNKVEMVNCFGFSNVDGFGKFGNTFTNTTPARTANSGIGCGFVNKYPAGRIGADESKGATEAEVMEHRRQDYLKAEKRRFNK